MTDDLIKGIKTRLQDTRLKTSALDQPTAHVVIADEKPGVMHVLTKKDAAPIDEMEARVGGPKGASLEVKESGTVDLGELGVWRDFVVSGLDKIPTAAIERGLNLDLLVKSKAVPGSSVFFASMDLGFAMSEVLSNDPKAPGFAVRPIPAGTRDGKEFVAVTPEMRPFFKLVRMNVDDTVDASVFNRAVGEWRKMQDAAAPILSAAITLGLPSLQSPMPNVQVQKKAPVETEETGPVSKETRAFLDEHNIELPASPTADDFEGVLDALPEGTPDAVAADVRAAYVTAQDNAEHADAAAEDELFGNLLGGDDDKKAATEKPSEAPVQVGNSRLAEAKGYRGAQLEEGLKGLGVPAKTTQKLADLLAEALQPSPRPSILIVAGNPRTPADKVMELATKIVNDNPLVIGREDLARAGFGPVYGHNNGVSTMRDAILSNGELGKHRPTAARHVSIVVEDLTGVGTATPDTQQATLKDWLQRVVLMGQTGRVQSYENDTHGSTSLANSVIVMRWPGDPADLKRALADPDLRPLLNNVIEVDETAAGSVGFLQKDLEARLVASGMKPGVKVSFTPDLQAALEKTYDELGAGESYERVASRLYAELKTAADALPSSSYTLGFSRGLTRGERDKVAHGLGVNATQLYDVAADAGGQQVQLRFNSRWEKVVEQAERVPDLEKEIVRLRDELKKRT